MLSRRLVFAFELVAAVLVGLILSGRVTASGRPPVPYAVVVTPKGSAEPTRNAGDTYKATFTIENTGTSSDTYHLTCGGDMLSCFVQESVTVAAGTLGAAKVIYVPGSDGTVSLVATGEAWDSGYKTVVVRPTMRIMAPQVTSDSTALVYSRMPLLQARLLGLDTTTLVVLLGADTITNLVRRNAGLIEWEVDSLHQLTPGTLTKFLVRGCAGALCHADTLYLKLDDSGKPWVSFSGMPLEAQGRVFGAPFGPGLSVSAAEVETGFSVPSYVSMDVARSTGLVYSTRQSHPRALVNTDIELSWPAGTPDQIKAVLIDGASRLDSVTVSSTNCSAAVGRRCRVALQGDFAGTTFPTATRKWLKVEVSVTSSGTTKTTTDSVEVVLVDRRSSSYGNGWAVSGVLRLDSADHDMILVGSTGTATIFRGHYGRYLAPLGDYSILAWTGSQWELTARGGGRLIFDAQGRQTKVEDLDGNQVTIAYSSSTDRITSITDPVGKVLTFGYDGSSKIATITDPGSRQNKITVNGSNQLTYDSISSPTSRAYTETFSYTSSGSNSAVVLASRTNAAGSATTVTYSGYRPTEVTLPAVDTGATPYSVNPVIQYAAQELRALGTLLSADSVYVKITDPRGNWTRSVLNRWGAAIITWDALGTLARASFTPEGFVAWSEGKVADSTRVLNTYDSEGHLVRVRRKHPGGGYWRVDSLAYIDHRVSQRWDSDGQATTFAYDGEGHLARTTTPTGDTTRYAYTALGQIDSTWMPNRSKGTKMSIDSTWHNVYSTRDPDGRLVYRGFDGVGHALAVERRVATRTSGDTTFYQWVGRQVTVNVAGQPTSVKVWRGPECLYSGCGDNDPPDVPDTASYDSVAIVYSRIGLDSLRINIYNQVMRTVYDALGRLVKRQPWYTGHASEVDSFRYDIAGNLRYQWTRRGTQITHYYDSRNRDTMTTVPGVGDYRRTFGGPNDELTRLWIASYVDSIGGVDPEVRWGYSQAGLLRADTSQDSLVTTYIYDRRFRDSVVTDVNGTWKLRYDASRGMLDTIITPFGDSLVYAYDTWERATGPVVRNGAGGYPITTAQTWSLAGELRSHTFVQNGWKLGGHEAADTTDQVTRTSIGWVEQHGPGTGPWSQGDALSNDGLGRLVAVTYSRYGAPAGSSTFTFDRDGGIRIGGEGTRTYDTTSSRLTYAMGVAVGHDAAGNQTSLGSMTFAYDALDRLVTVRKSDTLIARYAYDALGRRIVKRVYSAGPHGAATGFTRMIYRSGQVTAEADSAGSLTLGYAWGMGADILVGVYHYGSNNRYYIASDQIGSVRALTLRDGTWTGAVSYQAYGEKLDSAGTIPIWLRYRWMGGEFDAETQMYYLRARYYDPRIQRFVQEDPTGYAGGSNLYAYGNGNPTNGRDLDGLEKDPVMSSTPYTPGLECLGTTRGCYEDDLFSEYEWSLSRMNLQTAFGGCDPGDVACMIKADLSSGKPSIPGREIAVNRFPTGANVEPCVKVSGAYCIYADVSLAMVWEGVGGPVAGFRSALKAAQGARVTFEMLGPFFRATWQVIGRENGYVNWTRILDAEGRTVRLFKDVFDRFNRFVRRDIYPRR